MRPVIIAVVALWIATSAVIAQECPTCQYYDVTVRPDGDYEPNRPKNSTGHTVVFTVINSGNLTDTYTFTCSGTGGVTCTNVDPVSRTMLPAEEHLVTVTYNVGATGGQITLDALGSADIDPAHDTGHRIVTTPPTITLIVPKVTNGTDTAVVRSRTPLVLATYSADVPINLSSFVMMIGAEEVTKLARYNTALAEWEVDAAHELTPGVAQTIYVRICHVNTGQGGRIVHPLPET